MKFCQRYIAYRHIFKIKNFQIIKIRKLIEIEKEKDV